MQPYMPPECPSTYDIRNILHQSHFYNLTGQVLRLGEQHPDDKKKTVQQWFDKQMVQLVEEFRSESLRVDAMHYPGQLTVPKSTSEKYKEAKKEVALWFLTLFYFAHLFDRSKENLSKNKSILKESAITC